MHRLFIVAIFVFLATGIVMAASSGFNKLGESVSMRLAFHIGADKSDDSIYSSDNFISAEDSVLLALVAGNAFGTNYNSTYSPSDYLLELKQPHSNKAFLVMANATNETISDKLPALSGKEILGTRFGSYPTMSPQSFRIFLRLQYEDLDIINRIRIIPGIREIVIRNAGNNEQDLPQIEFEFMG